MRSRPRDTVWPGLAIAAGVDLTLIAALTFSSRGASTLGSSQGPGGEMALGGRRANAPEVSRYHAGQLRRRGTATPIFGRMRRPLAAGHALRRIHLSDQARGSRRVEKDPPRSDGMRHLAGTSEGFMGKAGWRMLMHPPQSNLAEAPGTAHDRCPYREGCGGTRDVSGLRATSTS